MIETSQPRAIKLDRFLPSNNDACYYQEEFSHLKDTIRIILHLFYESG